MSLSFSISTYHVHGYEILVSEKLNKLFVKHLEQRPYMIRKETKNLMGVLGKIFQRNETPCA